MCLCSGIGLLGGVAGGSYVHGLAVGAGHAVGLGCAGRDDVYIMKAGQSVQTSILLALTFLTMTGDNSVVNKTNSHKLPDNGL